MLLKPLLLAILFSTVSLASEQETRKFMPEKYTTPNQSLVDPLIQKVIIETLTSMNEPSLWEAPSDQPSFRFTWLRSFDEPIAIRISKNGNNYSAHTTVLEMDEKGKVLGIKTTTVRSVPKKKWNEFLALLKKSTYWELSPVAQPQFKDGWLTVTTDGAFWVLEANLNHRYHMVSMHSPENKEFRRLCLFLLRLSGLQIKPSLIY